MERATRPLRRIPHSRGLAALALVLVLVGAPVASGCGGEGDGSEASRTRGEPSGAGEVNVYSHRHYDADQQLFRRFEEETGITVNVQTASADELITRLQTEGRDSPADVLITVDAGRLRRAVEAGLLQPVSSEVLEANVPSHLRDPEGRWYGVTRRARILAWSRERVDSAELSTYEDLSDPRWEGRILVRSSENIYNQSLMASLIAHHDSAFARDWAEGVVANMARAPRGGDTDQIEDVVAGVGDVAVVNTYYVGRLLNADEARDRELASRVGVFFPNQEGRGAHVNVSGAGVTAHAPNRENAVRLLEFLTSDVAQRVFAEANFEYPVKPGVAWAATLRRWGTFEADTLNLSVLGELNDEAVRIFDRAGWR